MALEVECKKMNFFRQKQSSRNPTNAPRLKIFMGLVLLIGCLNLISAFEFDNVKDYDSATKTLTFKDSLLGIPTTTIATAKLNTPQVNYVMPGKDRLVAEFEVDLLDDTYTNALKGMEFVNLRTGKTFTRDFKYKYKSVSYVSVDKYDKICPENEEPLNKDGTVNKNCKIEKTGVINREVITWTDAPNKDLVKGKTIIGIFTDVYGDDYVEWYPTLMGLKVTEWATWTAGLNVGLNGYFKLNESSGTSAYDSITGYNMTTTSGNQNATGIIGGSYQPASECRGNGLNMGSWTEATINIWWTKNGAPSEGQIGRNNQNNAVNGLLYWVYENAQMSFVLYNGAYKTVTAPSLDTGWDMYTLIINASGLYAYRNASLVGITAVGFVLASDVFYMGGNAPYCNEYSTNIKWDEWSFWNRSLSDTEITQLYNDGVGMTYTTEFPPAPSTPTISIVYPGNGQTYTSKVSSINYTLTANTSAVNCWYTLNNGTTNTSMTCYENVSITPISVSGAYRFSAYVNDTYGTNSATSDFNIGIYPSIYYDSTTPTSGYNTSNNSFTVKVLFGQEDMSNITFRLWNSSGDLINTSLGTNGTGFYRNYTNTSFVDRNITFKISGGTQLICPECLTNTGTWEDMLSDSFCTPQSINFTNFSINTDCSRTDGIFAIRIPMGNPSAGISTDKFYGVVGNDFLANATLKSYACINQSTGATNITDCNYAVDNDLETYAGYSSNGAGYIARILINYTYDRNYTDTITNTSSVTYYNLSDDLYYYNVTAVDIYSNKNTTDTRTIRIDLFPPSVKIAYPLNGEELLQGISTNSFTKNLNYTITHKTALKSCYFAVETNDIYKQINISYKAGTSLVGSSNTDRIKCYDHDAEVYDSVIYTSLNGIYYQNFTIPDSCVNSNNEIKLRFTVGVSATDQGIQDLYELNVSYPTYNLKLNSYECQNGSGTITDCEKAVDGDFSTYSYCSGGLLGCNSYVYANYSLMKKNDTSCVLNTSLTNIKFFRNYTLDLFAVDNVEDINSSRINFRYVPTIVQNSIIANATTYETSRESFYLNVNYSTTYYNIITGKLFYNGSFYPATISDLGGGNTLFNVTLFVPVVYPTKVNHSYYWTTALTNASGTTNINFSWNNLTVDLINLSYCSQTNSPALNITNYDEQTSSRVYPFTYRSTFFYSVGQGNIFRNLSFQNTTADEVQFCINPNITYFLSGTIEYGNTSLYTTRNYFLNNFPINNITTNLFLYSLLTTPSVSFILHVQDTALLPLEDYTVRINKWFPGTNTYQTVQIVTTDSNGDGVAFLEIETVDYQFLIFDTNNNLVYTSEKMKIIPKETPYTIYFTVGTTLPNPIVYLENITGLTYSLSYDPNTKKITYTYTDTNSSFSKSKLYVFRTDPTTGNVDVCNYTLNVSTGVLICDLTGNATGQYMAMAYVFRGLEYFVNNVVFEIETFAETAGLLGVFGAFLLILVAAFAFAYNEVAGIIAVNLAIIFVNIIGLVHFGMVYITAIIAVSAILLVVLKRG